LTGGRFILGLGAGDAEVEHHAYGYPFPQARVRVAQLDEAASIIRALWRGGPATYTGAHYRIVDAYGRPIPEPPPVVMIGGGGERLTRRVVAQHADWWNCDYYSPPEYGRKLEILRSHCRTIQRSECDVGRWAIEAMCMSSAVIRDEVTERIAEFASIGVRHMQLNVLDFPRTDSLELFLSDVFLRFSHVGT
jgi:alkanesulfonate monooxygenase SsuD/methylene tetrahydromethanopterin reductase-like flavin-dependent oxidoreductase (luciferase family)